MWWPHDTLSSHARHGFSSATAASAGLQTAAPAASPAVRPRCGDVDEVGTCLPQKSGVIDDEHSIWVPEMGHHLVAQVVTDTIHIELGPTQQPLHTVRGHLARMLGDRPAVTTIKTRDQPAQIPRYPSSGLDPTEPRSDPLTETIQQAQPPINHVSHTRTTPGQRKRALLLYPWAVGDCVAPLRW